MENLKKAAVLLSGVLIIFLVAWILSVSEQSGQPGVSSQQSSILRGDDAITESEETPAINPAPRFRKPLPQRLSEQDTINWREHDGATDSPDAPAISGKIPMRGNPNAVFVGAANRILPAVVSIESIRRSRSSNFDFFHPFLKEDENKEKDDDGEFSLPGSGSGIIIAENGYILTNHHVVEDARELRVKLYDKREFDAKIIGSDPTTDLAVIKISSENLPAAFIGNSDAVMIGEWVMAVGNPLNFTSTVTTGIISALGRNINIIDGTRYRYKIENFIQTDAVINPGNSGGALVNLDGEVIGINTAIATRSGYYQGYGFSIPINLARKVSEDLIGFGRVRRAILGVSIEQVSDLTAKAMGLEKPTGALIQAVSNNSPAQIAGLRQGDIILTVDDAKVVSVNDLQIKIAEHRPGEVVTLGIWRNKENWEVDVTLSEAPGDNQPVAQQSESPDKKPEFETFGISLRELTTQEKEEFSLHSGLLIESVQPNSPAARAGIYRMDIVIQVDDVDIHSAAAFEKIASAAESGDFVKMTLKFRNNPDTRIAFIEMP